MKVTVAGASGLIGTKVLEWLKADGNDAVASSRSSGVDVLTGAGLADAPMRYAAVGGPNQVVSASSRPTWVCSPTQATYPSGRISTALGAVTDLIAGSSHAPSYLASIC